MEKFWNSPTFQFQSHRKVSWNVGTFFSDHLIYKQSTWSFLEAANEMINADGFIKLVTKEKYDAITAIEEADAKCTDQVLVCTIFAVAFLNRNKIHFAPSQIDVTSLEKEDRTQIHQTMKEIFNKVSSTTITEGDKKFIKCFRFNKKSMLFSSNISTNIFYLKKYFFFINLPHQMTEEQNGFGRMSTRISCCTKRISTQCKRYRVWHLWWMGLEHRPSLMLEQRINVAKQRKWHVLDDVNHRLL